MSKEKQATAVKTDAVVEGSSRRKFLKGGLAAAAGVAAGTIGAPASTSSALKRCPVGA